MSEKEAKARIKINKLLEEGGWRFFDDANGRANVVLENNVRITQTELDEFGEDFEVTKKGFIDFLLLDSKGFPLIVLEAKSEKINPLSAKEQAREYAKSQNVRFVILSNGNIHYFWDLESGSPRIITQFPTPESLIGYKTYKPNPDNLIKELVGEDYVVLTQRPHYQRDPQWLNMDERGEFVLKHKLKLLRPYQFKAVHAIQDAVAKNNDRFLFEMATGTGKTLTAAAVIRLFLRTGNARRVLFLVDRLERRYLYRMLAEICLKAAYDAPDPGRILRAAAAKDKVPKLTKSKGIVLPITPDRDYFFKYFHFIHGLPPSLLRLMTPPQAHKQPHPGRSL